MDWGMGFKHGARFRMFEQKNVMTSLLQCCFGFSACAIVLFCLTSNLYIQCFILGILGILIAVFVGMFIYFGATQPKLLQSERHIENMAVIEQKMADGKDVESIPEDNTTFVPTPKKTPRLTKVLKEESK